MNEPTREQYPEMSYPMRCENGCGGRLRFNRRVQLVQAPRGRHAQADLRVLRGGNRPPRRGPRAGPEDAPVCKRKPKKGST